MPITGTWYKSPCLLCHVANRPLGKLLLPLLADGLSGCARASVTPEVAVALAVAIGGMAAVGAVRSGESVEALWVYEQALELLLKLYRAPTQVRARVLNACGWVHRWAGGVEAAQSWRTVYLNQC